MTNIVESVLMLAGFTFAHAVWNVSDIPEGDLLCPLAIVQNGDQRQLPRTRVCELIKRGISQYWAVKVGTTRKGVWRLSENTTVAKALPVAYFCKQLGLVLPG